VAVAYRSGGTRCYKSCRQQQQLGSSKLLANYLWHPKRPCSVPKSLDVLFI